ncbi:YciI family protein [Paenibacillus sp. LPE1-1-1.1]|uniref:YciI family protein n=1 Tax=Paenibacillus sp. LPE1-1-1.1 TaxID=3135230 RepID=UPI003415B5CD
MRYMLMVKATKHSEAGVKPGWKHHDAMAAYNEALDSAGVLLAVEELRPSSSGLRITYPVSGEMPEIMAGPFAETGSLVAGYTLIDVKTEEEAIAWAMRMPHPSGCSECEIELRLLFDNESLLRASESTLLEADLRDQIDMLKKS